MELQFLADEGLLARRITTGALRHFPQAMQHTAATQMIDYLSVDTGNRLVQVIKCTEDLRYVMETVGCVFSFSAVEFGSSITKALDVYATIMGPPVVDVLPPLLGPDREPLLTDMARHLTQLFVPRQDFPAGSASHLVLLGRMLNHFSGIITFHENRLSAGAWGILLRAFIGSLHFACIAPQTFPEIRSAISSVVIELLVRSKASDPELWDGVVKRHFPKGFATVAQWGAFLVAITRSITSLLSARPLPPEVLIQFEGMPPTVRKTIRLVGYSPAELTFVWKRLLTVLGPLEALQDHDALESASRTLRDVVVLSGCASYWRHDADPRGAYDFRKAQPAANVLLPPGPSTDALVKVAASAAFGIALRGLSTVGSSTFTRARARAVEAACAIFLRRESEAACSPSSLDLFFNFVVAVSGDESLWSPLLLNTVSLYQLDLQPPSRAVTALSSVVCAVFFSEESARADVVDEDLADDEGPDDEALMQKLAVLECAAQHAVGLYSLAAQMGEKSVTSSLGSALLCAIEKHSHHARLLHLLFAAILTGVAQAPRCVLEDPPTYTEMAENAMALLRAPYGTYPVESLCMAINFIGWLRPISTSVTTAIVVALSTFCHSVRRLEGQADGTALALLFDTACRALSHIIASDRALLAHDAIALSAFRVVDVGSKPIAQVRAAGFRNSAMWLFYTLLEVLAWPHIDGCSAFSSGVSESDFVGRATSVRFFEVNGSRIVTALEIAESASEATSGGRGSGSFEKDVVLIIRDAFGRRAFRFRREAGAADVPDPLLHIPELDPVQRHELPVEEEQPTDALRFVLGDQRTTQLLDSWGADPALRQLIAECGSAELDALDDTAFDVRYRLSTVGDPCTSSCGHVRWLLSDLGMSSARTHELPADDELVSLLKGLDALDMRDCMVVPVVLLVDGNEAREEQQHPAAAAAAAASPAFEAFMSALGWQFGAPSRGTACVHADVMHHLTFEPVVFTAAQFAATESQADALRTPGDPRMANVRIIWDGTFAKFGWAASQQPLHEHLASICPQFRACETERFFDFVISPLRSVGMYSVRLRFPNGLAKRSQLAWEWDAPLVHGCLVSAEALPELVRISVAHAVVQRERARGAYVSPLLVRRHALRSILRTRAADPSIDALPTQAIVSLFGSLRPRKRAGVPTTVIPAPAHGHDPGPTARGGGVEADADNLVAEGGDVQGNAASGQTHALGALEGPTPV